MARRRFISRHFHCIMLICHSIKCIDMEGIMLRYQYLLYKINTFVNIGLRSYGSTILYSCVIVYFFVRIFVCLYSPVYIRVSGQNGMIRMSQCTRLHIRMFRRVRTFWCCCVSLSIKAFIHISIC